MIPLPAPLLADAIGAIMTVIFLVIAFVGWVMNLINGQNQRKPQQRPQPRPVRDRRLLSEIDSFLKQATGGKPAGDEIMSADDIEVVEAPRATRPAPRRRAPQRSAAPPTPTAVPVRPTAGSRPGENFSHRKSVAADNLGENVRQHLQVHMPQRMEAQVSRDVPHAVANSVSAHLGRSATLAGGNVALSVSGVDSTPTSFDMAALLSALKNEQGIRQAVLTHEILSPPLSRRRR